MLNKFMIISAVILITISLPTISQAWIIFHKPAFKGKVIDSATKLPIKGAVAVVVYNKTLVAGFEPITSAFDVREALTDDNGIFDIPSYTSVINPLSVSANVNIIIYKPGFGEYSPINIPADVGIDLDLQERFFSEDFGKEIKLWLYPNIAKSDTRQMYMVTFGVVELPILKTREERRKSIPSLPSALNLFDKQKNLIRLINEENDNLGLQKTDPYKYRDFILHRGEK